MAYRCANRNCGATLTSTTRSRNDSAYCADCGDPVWAFRPHSDVPDDWFCVTTSTTPVPGAEVDGDQCEICGLTGYRIEQRGRWTWVAVCAGQHYDGDWLEGCGREHPVRQKRAFEVIF